MSTIRIFWFSSQSQRSSLTLWMKNRKPLWPSRNQHFYPEIKKNEAATQRFFLVNIWWEINVPPVTYSHIRQEKRRDSLQIQAGVTFRSSATTPMNITKKNICESNKILLRKKEWIKGKKLSSHLVFSSPCSSRGGQLWASGPGGRHVVSQQKLHKLHRPAPFIMCC